MHAWSLEIVENLEHFTNLCANLAQGPCWFSPYRSIFNISFAVANRITQPCTWTEKSLSLARQPLLVVALNYRSFAPSLRCQAAAKYGCSRSWLNVSWARKQRSTQSPTYWQYGEGVSARMVTWDCSRWELMPDPRNIWYFRFLKKWLFKEKTVRVQHFWLRNMIELVIYFIGNV